MQRTLSLLLACLLTAVLGAQASADIIVSTINEDFNNATNVNLNGVANINANTLQLTPKTNSVFGSGVIAQAPPAVGTYDRIQANFAFLFDPNSDTNEADGGSFLLVPNTQPPLNGSNELPGSSFNGDAEFGNVAGAFAVSFDIHDNGTANPGISLRFDDNAQTTAQLNPTFDFSDGVWHEAQLEIKFLEGGGADVSLAVVEDIFGTPGSAELLFDDVNFAGLSPMDFRFAAAARTGGQNADQRIDALNAQFTLTPEPSSVAVWVLVGVIGFGGIFLQRRRRRRAG